MISSHTANVSQNLSNVQTGDVAPRRQSGSGYVKLPVPAIDFQQQIVQTATPIDEVTIDAAAEVENAAVPADQSREQIRAAALPRLSRPVSDPPISEAPNRFPSVDVSSEPNLESSLTQQSGPLDRAQSLPSLRNTGRTHTDTSDQLELSNEAQVQENRQAESAERLAEKNQQVRESRKERLSQQHQQTAEALSHAQDGNSGTQAINKLA